jgi:hypothetical protein
VALTATHRRRLREVWRSAGWPCHDAIELDLLAAGLLERRWDAEGRETLRVTDAGLQGLAEARQRHQAAYTEHEALVARVAREMQRAGRIAWRGLSLRAPLSALPAETPAPVGVEVGIETDTAATPARPPTVWAMAMPDVYSIRHTTVEDYVEPIVHEVKVRRADLLGDLKRPAKGEAYRALCGECWYVLKAGIGEADEVPEVYGVMVAHPLAGAPESAGLAFGALEVLRPAPKRSFRLPFSVWMALARANAEPADEESAQGRLGAPEIDQP